MSLSDIVLPAGAAMQMLTALCDASFDSILVTDATSAGNIVYANAAFRELTGYSLEAVRGKSPKILQGPATDARVLERLTSMLKSGDGTFEGTNQPTRYLMLLSYFCLIHPFPAGKAINYKNDSTAFIMHWRVVPVRVEGVVTFWLAIQREAGSM
jgi:PAS domain-containing protein